MIKSQVVFVLGPYRSGTSLTSRITSDLGVAFGEDDNLIPADARNPSGYFERNDLNETNRAYIEATGGSLEKPGLPEDLSQQSNYGILQSCDLSWMERTPVSGIKDPRMCATLHAWFQAQIFDPKKSRIIQICRNPDAIIKSAIAHDHVAQYCEGDPKRIEAMIHRYIELSNWQVKQACCPVLSLNYEDLIADPIGKTGEIASFLGVSSPQLIQKAAKNIGKDRAQQRLRSQKSLKSLRFRLGGLRNKMRYALTDLIRKIRLGTREDDTASVQRLFPLLRMPKHVPGNISWRNTELAYVDAPAVYYQLSDIYIKRAYDFACSSPSPYILDVGAHIGLAALRFREQFPTARIIAFEPDPAIVGCLRNNLSNYKDTQTEVIAAAAWTEERAIGFKHTGDDSGAIFTTSPTSEVPTIDLATYCTETVDFLKLDIEGAEFEVLHHLRNAGVLKNVRRIFLELHHWDSPHPPRFHEALNIITEAGFDYRISSSEVFSEEKGSPHYDLNTASSNLVILNAWRRD